MEVRFMENRVCNSKELCYYVLNLAEKVFWRSRFGMTQKTFYVKRVIILLALGSDNLRKYF